MDIDKDFSRNVWCLLGLTFDAVDTNQAAIEILSAANENRRCFLSTPNLNFLCESHKDIAFRESVINSDLSIADGFPIVLTAKLLGIPLPERVAGSSLVEYLYQRNTDVPLKIFFFGGEPGVAEKASFAVNRKPSGLVSVGHYTPGFGTIEEMSKPEIIEYINQHDVEFLIVAISAKKGQAWIELNRHLLKAPVISHLGAVINFYAGTIKRAPEMVQRMRLEWLWRIYQEPSLWKRYYDDGFQFLSLLVRNIFPYWLWLKFHTLTSDDQPVSIQTSITTENCYQITLSGSCTYRNIMPLRSEFKKAVSEKRDVRIDLNQVKTIDSAFLGLSLILYKHLKNSGHSIKFTNLNKNIRRILKWQKVADLLA
jgi:N-acetylglucosaminyldiphosphoundecaprenol N-acetyl-beta-D-mannosaminyltransferase